MKTAQNGKTKGATTQTEAAAALTEMLTDLEATFNARQLNARLSPGRRVWPEPANGYLIRLEMFNREFLGPSYQLLESLKRRLKNGKRATARRLVTRLERNLRHLVAVLFGKLTVVLWEVEDVCLRLRELDSAARVRIIRDGLAFRYWRNDGYDFDKEIRAEPKTAAAEPPHADVASPSQIDIGRALRYLAAPDSWAPNDDARLLKLWGEALGELVKPMLMRINMIITNPEKKPEYLPATLDDLDSLRFGIAWLMACAYDDVARLCFGECLSRPGASEDHEDRAFWLYQAAGLAEDAYKLVPHEHFKNAAEVTTLMAYNCVTTDEAHTRPRLDVVLEENDDWKRARLVPR